jgi:hypothetical protein
MVTKKEKDDILYATPKMKVGMIFLQAVRGLAGCYGIRKVYQPV